LQVERLEERRLLAVGPQLFAVRPYNGALLQDGDTLHVAPREINLLFKGGAEINETTIPGNVVLTRSGHDGGFDDGHDVVVDIGFVGLKDADNRNQIVLRPASFSALNTDRPESSFPDDMYRLDVNGSTGTPLSNNSGEAFNDGNDFSLQFTLDLGAQVVSVVPEPITRDSSGLVQDRNQIVVYFNEDDLDPADAVDPALYRLVDTSATADTADDTVLLPTSVSYDADANTAVLNFSGSGISDGTYRVDIGSTDEPNDAPTEANSVGTLFLGNTFTLNGVLGDSGGSGSDRNDQDWYRGRLSQPGNVTISVTPSGGDFDPIIEVYEGNGTTLIVEHNMDVEGQLEQLTVNGVAAGDFFVRVLGDTANPNHEAAAYQLELSATPALTVDDNNSSFRMATHLGRLGAAGQSFASLIETQSIFMPQFPGSVDEPGHRDIQGEQHITDDLTAGLDFDETELPNGIEVVRYYFGDDYGTDSFGNILSNQITDGQRQRVREIFDLYSSRLGIEFVEITSGSINDLQVVVGSIPAVTNADVDGVFGLTKRLDHVVALVDATQFSGDDAYGGAWFNETVRQIGKAVAFDTTPWLVNSYDLISSQGPGLTIGPNSAVWPGDPAYSGPAGEPVYPGDNDLVHHARERRPDSTDIDLFHFELDTAGVFSAEIVAQRTNSLLNSVLTLFDSDGQVVAQNDDYFSKDSYLELELEPGMYYVGVTSTGNADFDPTLSDSGFGGVTDGAYQLDLNFATSDTTHLRDATGVAFDGDADGVPGGDFHFWFQSSSDTIYVDKANDQRAGVFDGDGSLTGPAGDPTRGPYDNLQFALQQAANRIVSPAPGDLLDGDKFVLMDDTNAVTFEFNMTGANPPNGVDLTAATSPTDVAVAIETAVNAAITGALLDGVTVSRVDNVVRFTDVQGLDVRQSAGLLATPNIVRIVGNGGIDGDLSTPVDNLPYLLGRDNSNFATEDGADFLVPQGTTVMIDAGALLKMRRVNLDAGTSSLGVDRSDGAIQLLGIPDLPVLLRSFRDDTVGGDSDGVGPAPIAGDFGGIVFRKDSDLEEEGIFLNWVNHADIQRGGGKVPVDSGEQVFTPIHMIEARPTVSFNKITQSAGAALSGDPNSFSDVDGRIGPDIHGNTLVDVNVNTGLVQDNSVNGLFIRIETQDGRPVDKLTESARFNDADIPHVITENFHIVGNPGGTLNGNARLSGRLQVDPGVVIKLDDVRIEAERGAANFIAEGSSNSPAIFTSVKDDRFGGSGTFNSDGGSSNPTQGDWGGLVFNAVSTASIDHALITFAGGQTPIEGNFAVFSAVEAHQAKLRLTNSTLENNASGRDDSDRNGRGSNTDAVIFLRGAQPILVNNIIRDNNLDRLGNAAPTNVISINANALSSNVVRDYGRSTGGADRFEQFGNNRGPLVRLNKLDNNGTNGMEVRGAYLTTETIWDDTDIVHVVRNEIMVGNHHTFSGLRLQSSNTESLVVKLTGSGAGFTASGRDLDIDDRIGGTLHIVGTIGHPVVLTSLADDTVGAGFTPNGDFQSDTDNRVTEPMPGQWRSLLLKEFSNDRNVAIIGELEDQFTDANETNADTSSAEPLGELAPDEKSGDENRRLGFEVHGLISPDDPADQDVYSFIADAGTRVWIDLDRTASALDATIELLNINGEVLASSTNNSTLTGVAETLRQNTLLGSDYYSLNRLDPGMSLLLPGTGNGTYFLRVRSNGPTVVDSATRSLTFHDNGIAADTISVTNADFLTAGFQPGQRLTIRDSANNNGQHVISAVTANELTLASNDALVDESAPTGTRVRADLTSGQYQLQIRLQQRDEKPGSAVRFADIRYATTGIEVRGLPAHSNLLGESGEPVGGDVSDASGGAFDVGNVLTSDRSAISLSGTIGSETDVDWYQFTVDHDLVENAAGDSGSSKTVALVFDLDYADGLTRPDTTIAIYNEQNELIYIGRESNVTDDLPAGSGNDLDDLTRGSAGNLDPYIGPFHLPVGFENGNSETYRVAVMSNRSTPNAIAGFYLSGGGTAVNRQNLRLEPANGVQRIVEDHIGRSDLNSGGYSSGTPLGDTISSIENRFEASPLFRPVLPDTPRILFTETASSLTANVVPFRLDDVRLYVSTEEDIFAFDALNANNRVDLGDAPEELEDIVFRSDGRLYGYRNRDIDDREGDGDFRNELPDVAGALLEIDASNATIISSQDDGIRGPMLLRTIPGQGATPPVPGPIMPEEYRHDITLTDQVDALTFKRDGADDPLPDAPRYDVFYSVRDPWAGASKLFWDDDNGLDNATVDVADGAIDPPPSVDVEDENDTRHHGQLVGYIGATKGFVRTNMNFATIGFFPHAVGPASNDIKLDIIQSPADPGPAPNPVVLVLVDQPTKTITATIRHNMGGTAVSAQELVDAINSALDVRGQILGFAAVMDAEGGNRVSDSPTTTPPVIVGDRLLTTSGGAQALRGVTTGLAFVDANGDGDTDDAVDKLYGVTDDGEFFRVENNFSGENDEYRRFSGDLPTANVTVLSDLGGVFEYGGLSVGPQNMRDLNGNNPGFYSQMLFAIDTDGTLVAFDTSGNLQSVFDGASSRTLNVPFTPGSLSNRVTGLAFSPLDFNLWHPTQKRALDNGHGINDSIDNERRPVLERESFGPNPSNDGNGNQSLHFSLEQFDDSITVGEYKYQTYFDDGNGSTAQLGILSNLAHNDLTWTGAIGENYNLPGGALGSLVTGTFSLNGYTSDDKPSLYFNYFLETENRQVGDPFVDPNSREMRDSARVFISNDGVSWDLVSTNNSSLSREQKEGDLEAELSTFISHNATANLTENPNSISGGRTVGEQQVQELFDNTGIWRQARVDLDQYAGLSNLRLRFDFSTAGTMDENLPGDEFGMFDESANDTLARFVVRERGQNNAFEGFYIDDIIVGLSERGEMVTGAGTDTAIFDLESNIRTRFADPTAPNRHLTGDYQLNIRRATEYAEIITGRVDNIVMKANFPFNSNDRFILETGPSNSRQGIGDRNIERDQGQLIIDSNVITDSLNFGIDVSAGPRSGESTLPQPGSAIRFDTPNEDLLYPGAVLQNNIIAFVGEGGIRFSGDSRSPANAPVPFGRAINNTIYNGNRTGSGILIENNASPTLLNNVIANASNAISNGAGNNTLVIGSNLFHGNDTPTQPSDATAGSNPLFQLAADPLLVDPENRNFYIEAGSRAIDSSLNTLSDRSDFANFKAELGIPQSNMRAPDRDVYGQTRVDDATADPLGGGSSIFKDRGAVDRADDEQPFAELILPVDNDVERLDLDPNPTVIRLESNFLEQFSIFLGDGPGPNSPFQGTGVDPITVDDPNDPLVSMNAVRVTRNSVPLVEDVDYTLGFSANNNVLLLTPLSTLWEPDSVYVVELDNTQIKDLAENPLRRNQPSGATMFTVLLGDLDLDFGDAPDFDYGTLLNNDGARHVIVEGGSLFLGSGVDTEPDGQPVVRSDGENHADGDDTDQFIDVSASGLTVAAFAPFTVQLPIDGGAGIGNGEMFTIDPDGAGPEDAIQFQFDLDGDVNLAPPLVPIDFFTIDNVNGLANRVVSAISSALPSVTVSHLGGGAVQIDGDSAMTLDLTGAASLMPSTRLPVGVKVPDDSAPIQDEDIFVLLDGVNAAVTFEFEDDTVTAGLTDPSHVPVNFTGGPGYDPNQITSAIAAAIEDQVASGGLQDLSVTAAGDTVSLTGDVLGVGDDEDGVSISNQFVTGAAVDSVWRVDVVASGNGKLDAWVDFDQNGQFTAAEKLPLNGTDSSSVDVVAGMNNFSFDIGLITGATVRGGLTYARFRLSTTGDLLPQGLAVGGEVEDHEISVLSNAAPFVANSFVSLLSTNPTDVLGTTLTQDLDGDSVLDATDNNSDGVLNLDENALQDAVEAGVDLRINLENVNGKPVFDDVDISNGNVDSLVYSLVSNTNSDLVSVSLTGGVMDLDFAQDRAGTAEIVVRATDQAGLTVEDTLTILVNDPAPPAPVDDTYITTPISEDDVLTVTAANGVLINDIDDEGNTFDAVPVIDGTSSAGALYSIDADGSFSYDPRQSAELQLLPSGGMQDDTFVYQAADGAGNVVGSASVTIRVTGANDAPMPADDDDQNTNGLLNVAENSQVTVGQTVLLDNDVDDTGDSLRIVSVDQTATQGLVRLFLNASVSYNPDRQFKSLKVGESATDTFTYTIEDQHGAQGPAATVTVTVHGVNDAPAASDDPYSTDEDTVLQVDGPGVLLNDSDPENETLSTVAEIKTSALGADVSIGTDGTFTYDPTQSRDLQSVRLGQLREDTFSYTATDGFDLVDATVTVTVSGRNDAPSALGDDYVVNEDTVLEASTLLGVLANDFDFDGDSLTAEVEQPPTNGVLSMGPDGSFSYEPDADFFGTDSFTYRVSDGGLSSVGTATIDVINVNDPPDANNDQYSVEQESTLTVPATGVLENDTSIDRSSLTAAHVSGPEFGILTLESDGSFVYTPNDGFFGRDTFRYRAVDTIGAGAVGTVIIDVINIHPWQNSNSALDVNGDGFVSPVDVLIIINYLNANGPGPVPVPTPTPPPFRDVNGDDMVTSADALAVINALNLMDEGEGEAAGDGVAQSPTSDVVVTPLFGASNSFDTVARASQPATREDRPLDELFGNGEVDALLSSNSPSRLAATEADDELDFESLLDELVDDLDGDDHDALFGRLA
jgi:VCBS repeat-containing protein